MESQSLINVMLGVACAVIGWLARELWTAVKDLQEDLTKLSVELPKTYVTRDDYREDIKGIKEMLAKIFDKLEKKADK
jgi:uncharacterized coiled-coil DUF342 family protein